MLTGAIMAAPSRVFALSLTINSDTINTGSSIFDINLGGGSPNTFNQIGGVEMGSAMVGGDFVVGATQNQAIGRGISSYPSDVCSKATLSNISISYQLTQDGPYNSVDGATAYLSLDGLTSLPVVTPAAGGYFSGGMMPNLTGIGTVNGALSPGTSSQSGPMSAVFDASGYTIADITNLVLVQLQDNIDDSSGADYIATNPNFTINYDDSVCATKPTEEQIVPEEPAAAVAEVTNSTPKPRLAETGRALSLSILLSIGLVATGIIINLKIKQMQR